MNIPNITISIARWQPPYPISLVLGRWPYGERDFFRLDRSDDAEFYAEPKWPRLGANEGMIQHLLIITLWLFNIAMENGSCIDGLPIYSMVIFHGYVKYPEGNN